MLEKVKGESPSDNEKVKQYEKNIKELADKLTLVSKEKEDALKEQLRKFEEEKSGMMLDMSLKQKFAEFTFADEFIPLKEAIIKNVVDTVKSKNALQLDDKGQILVVDIDPTTRVAKPKFNGNDPVTIDSLLSDPLKNFLKKNNTGDNTTGKDKGGRATPPSRRETFEDIDINKMTLPQRRAYEASKV
jgi:hypothetical protein